MRGSGGALKRKMRDRVIDHERTIIVVDVVVIFVVCGAEIDARTTFQRSKESRSDVGTYPVGYSVEFVA